MRRQDNNTRTEFPLTRWSLSPVILGLVVGALAGPVGLRLLEPHIPEDTGLIESVSQVALLLSLFCVGLRLRVPFEWRAWRMSVRLCTVTLLATALLAGALAHVLFDFGLIEALLLGIVLAPTDAVLASDIHVPAEGELDSPPVALAAEGAMTSGLAAPLVALTLAFIGVGEGEATSGTPVWPVLELLWSLVGGVASGWLIGAGMSRWIRMLDTDRHGDFLEEMIVFATAALAYTCALALRTEGLLAVFAAGLALSHGGRIRRSVRRYSLGPRVLKLAGRVERLAVVVVMVLLGALVAGVEFHIRRVLFALALLVLLRPLAVRLGLGGLSMPPSQRRTLEWFGARGAASLYCLALAINHGLSSPLARELAAITLVFIVTSIVFSAVSALSLRRASPGAVDL